MGFCCGWVIGILILVKQPHLPTTEGLGEQEALEISEKDS
jgi:hypothetical protein